MFLYQFKHDLIFSSPPEVLCSVCMMTLLYIFFHITSDKPWLTCIIDIFVSIFPMKVYNVHVHSGSDILFAILTVIYSTLDGSCGHVSMPKCTSTWSLFKMIFQSDFFQQIVSIVITHLFFIFFSIRMNKMGMCQPILGKKIVVTSAHVYTLTLVRLKWRQWNLNNLNNNIHLSTHKNYIKWDCICMKANRQTIWKNSITLHYNAFFPVCLSNCAFYLFLILIFNFILFFAFPSSIHFIFIRLTTMSMFVCCAFGTFFLSAFCYHEKLNLKTVFIRGFSTSLFFRC